MEETAQDTLPLPFLGAARHPRHLFRQEVAHGMKRLVLVAFVTVECLHVATRAPHILGHDTDKQGLAYARFSPYQHAGGNLHHRQTSPQAHQRIEFAQPAEHAAYGAYFTDRKSTRLNSSH